MRKRIPLAILRYAVLAGFALVAVYPLFWMFTTSFRTQAEVDIDKWALPRGVVLDNFRTVFVEKGFGRYILNSVIVTGAAVLLTLVAATLAGFVFARLRFRGRTLLFFIFLAGMMIPVHIVLIPLLKIFGSIQLHLVLWARGTGMPRHAMMRLLMVFEHGSLIVTYVAFSLPLSIFIFRGFFERVPAELEEAARIDGCSAFGVFWHVMLPLARPAVAVVTIFNVVTLWNEFVFALTLLHTDALRTIPLGMFVFSQEQLGPPIPLLCAALSVSVLPMLLVYVLAQKHIIRGLTAGAIKG